MGAKRRDVEPSEYNKMWIQARTMPLLSQCSAIENSLCIFTRQWSQCKASVSIAFPLFSFFISNDEFISDKQRFLFSSVLSLWNFNNIFVRHNRCDVHSKL